MSILYAYSSMLSYFDSRCCFTNLDTKSSDEVEPDTSETIEKSEAQE